MFSTTRDRLVSVAFDNLALSNRSPATPANDSAIYPTSILDRDELTGLPANSPGTHNQRLDAYTPAHH